MKFRKKRSSVIAQVVLALAMLILSATPNHTPALVMLGDSTAQHVVPPDAMDAPVREQVAEIPADNINYEELLSIQIWRDGSVRSDWFFDDAGNGLLSFPGELPDLSNMTFDGVRDMHIDFMICESPQIAPEWGQVPDFELFEGGGYDDHSVLSSNEVVIRFQIWNGTYGQNDSYPMNNLNASQAVINGVLDGLSSIIGSDFHLMTNRTATLDGDFAMEQYWRAFVFDPTDAWPELFETVPLGEGLAPATSDKLMAAKARSLYISTDFDESPYRGGSAGLEEEDERWEFDTTLSVIEKDKLTLGQISNKIFLAELADFGDTLRSNDNANESIFGIQIPYGANIDDMEPYNEDEENGVGYVILDLIEYHDSRLTSLDYIEFTLDALPMPSILLTAEASDTIVSTGDIVRIDYTARNLGEANAYDVRLWGFDNETGGGDDGDEWIIMNTTHPGSSYTLLTGGQVYHEFGTIAGGTSATFSVTLNATTPNEQANQHFVSSSYVRYSAATDAVVVPGWVADDIQNWGNDLDFWYNHNSAGVSFNLQVNLTASTVHIGDVFNTSMEITNTGNETAWDVEWRAPRFAINLLDIEGTIDSIAPGETVVVRTAYIIDVHASYVTRYDVGYLPTRQLGGTLDLGFWSGYYDGRDLRPATDDADGGQDYSGWQITEFVDNDSVVHDDSGDRGDVYASELRIDILPQPSTSVGSWLTVDVRYSQSEVVEEDLVQVTIAVTNVGDIVAEEVTVTAEFSDSDFEFFAGAGTVYGSSTTQGMRVVFYWGKLAPAGEFEVTFLLEAIANTTVFTHTSVVEDWGALAGGVERTYYPRTFDWEAPLLGSPDDATIDEGASDVAGTLVWTVADEHAGSYRIMGAEVIEGDEDLELVFTTYATGIWSDFTADVAFSLSSLEAGEYRFRLEATDSCGNTATSDLVNVVVEAEGFGDKAGDFFSDNTGWLITVAVISAVAIAEGVMMLRMRSGGKKKSSF